ncbi:hypothetical protein [Pseudoramibacter alactolyticus]|uniref:HflX-like GTP-binding protein n=1 Tax=Pseudoramibacter alactolyticus TaxID=113287 RepID=UPI0028EB4FEA|nr:hypothetical protein [Pseudoramibacter alactolyticus]
MKQSLYTTAPQPECALLIGIASADDQTASPAMAELARLAQTAGCDVFATLVQPRQKPDPKTFLGKGKIAEAAQLVTANELDLIIADDELTPGQIAAIEAAAASARSIGSNRRHPRSKTPAKRRARRQSRRLYQRRQEHPV